jgi:heat shock protein HslJ
MMRFRALWVVAPAVLLLSACGTSSPQAGTDLDLEGSSWVLSTLTVDGVETPAVPAATATLVFGPDGEVSGSTGCNRFIGEWEQDASALTISVAGSTMAACAAPELSEQEQLLLEALAQTGSARQTGETLELLDGDSTVLLRYDASLTQLGGTSWQATGVNNRSGGVESTALTSSVTAQFGDDGEISGFSGCRDYTGRFVASEDVIEVTDISLVGDECSGDPAALEANVVAALEASQTFTIEGATLTLRDSEGATQLSCQLST